MNNRTKQFASFGVLGLLGMMVATAFSQNAGNGNDVKKLLAGDTVKQWSLRSVKTFEITHQEKNFNDNDEFELKNDLAQLVPYSIIFNAEGTCVVAYLSQYKEGKVVETDYLTTGKWWIEGKDVKIIEDEDDDKIHEEKDDSVMRLKDFVVTENSLKSKFDLQGSYTGGVEELGYVPVE